MFIKEFDPVGIYQKMIDDRRKKDLKQLQIVLEQYYKDNGRYPKSRENKIVRFDDSIANWGESWPPYMEALPKDSDSKKNYVYYTDDNGQKYYLYATLERKDDLQACWENGEVCSSIISNEIDENACGGVCNFALTSKNAIP